MINVDTRLGQRVADFTIYRRRNNELNFTSNSVGEIVDGLCLLSEDKEGKVSTLILVVVVVV